MDDLFAFRKWLFDQGYAPKTVDAILVLTKQAFKWAWRHTLTRDYRLAAVSLPKAKASPQPCFTTEQVESLLKTTDGEDRLAYSMMAYAGLRIGEVEQIRWEDIRQRDGKPSMFHIRRGGSGETTKDKDERFVPVHPRIADYIGESKKAGPVFMAIRARDLLMRLKVLCKTCGFEKPDTFKLHSFRHHFASLCANHHVAYRKALAWLGHSSSEMLDLYYHLHDDDSQQAMLALAGINAGSRDAANASANNGSGTALAVAPENRLEGSLRAVGQSTIEKRSQVREFQEFVNCL
ncbi:MAG: tyrosine-type recombinase/integrase [Phycisphaerae bacterium]